VEEKENVWGRTQMQMEDGLLTPFDDWNLLQFHGALSGTITGTPSSVMHEKTYNGSQMHRRNFVQLNSHYMPANMVIGLP
jgi:hypothetical protein